MNAPATAPTSEDRMLGCLHGGALGDALGLPYENRVPPFEVSLDRPLHISDDTQLTIATCEAILRAGSVDPATIAAVFAEWHRLRRFSGLGASTLKALGELVTGGHWALVGRKGDRAAGVGAAMRIAPLAFLCDPADDAARRAIRDVSRITHHSEEAYVGALAVVVAVRAAWLGEWTGGHGLIELVAAVLPDSSVRDRLRDLASARGESLAAIGMRFGTSGYVVDAVPFAIAAAERVAVGFEKLLLEVVACGGDADTTASLTGQIVGANLGVSAVSHEWLARLSLDAHIADTARSFASKVAHGT